MKIRDRYPIVVTEHKVACRDFWQRYLGLDVLFDSDWFVLLGDAQQGSVVAELEIHIDRDAAATMKPAISRWADVPTSRMILSAMRRCRYQACMARAAIQPPSSKKITGAA